MDTTNMYHIRNGKKKFVERSKNAPAIFVRGTLLPVLKLAVHNSGRMDINGYIQDTYRMPNV